MHALFDLDDTVHNKTQSLKLCAKSIHSKFLNNDVSANGFIDAFVTENSIIQPKAQVFEILAAKFNIDLDTKSKMFKYFDESFHHYAKRFDGVIECMDYLKSEGVKIACVTNGRDFFQRNKITALGLEKYFDVIVTSGELAIKKPDPVIFNTALVRLGAFAKESVFIGDSLKSDMEPAKKLGMKTIWVNSQTNSKPECVDYQLSTFADFIGIWQVITKV
ncbi:HAD family hydrolase [Reinekea sp.]|uniref:HAD family hydrolase n=1 Tax=Reinekea sp. TaxID=1970455 RepID=UPI00398A3977